MIRPGPFRQILIPAAAALFFSISATGADAAGPGGLVKGLPKALGEARAATPTLAPFAYVIFCKQEPEECRPGGGPERVDVSDAAVGELVAVNDEVNRSIRPVNDRPRNGLADVWSLDPPQGDCEDYALTKRHRLIRAGWPAGALRIAVVRTRSGEGHAVLLVRTDRGDLVLDNLNPRITGWKSAGLTLVKVQSGAAPKRWFTL
jgi:predicted transglutaminase-like cysteine proteinase